MDEYGLAGMTALGDQIQQACTTSGMHILGFVIVGHNGLAEYRSSLDTSDFKDVLYQAAEAL